MRSDSLHDDVAEVIYRDALTEAMTRLSKRPDTLFLGQSVEYPGTGMFTTLAGVPVDQRLEVPVFENTQMGLSIGLSLAGYRPVSIFPRINFLLSATDALVSHLDKFPLMGDPPYRPRVIIRTAVAGPHPLDPGPQQLGDYSPSFDQMLQTVRVVRLLSADAIVAAYETAYDFDGSTLLIEYVDLYETG